MKKTVSVIAISCLTLLAGCSNQGDDQAAQTPAQQPTEQAAAPATAAPVDHSAMPGHSMHQGSPVNQQTATVVGVTHAAGYTYLEITMNGKNTWIAASPVSVKTGDTVAWSGGAVMQNFTSKSLRQTFPEIIFVDQVTVAQ